MAAATLAGGKLAKAQQGILRHPLPVGLVYDLTDTIVFDPDEQVTQAMVLVFETFARCRSGLGVVRHFRHHAILFPTRARGTEELSWQPLTHSRVREVLHNPFYAGAYVYGRFQQSLSIPGKGDGGSARKTRKPHEWPIVLLDHHRGYLSWEEYLHNQQQPDQNCTHGFEERPGVVRSGAALLQGLLCCGICGHRMRVHYPKGSNDPVYVCNYRRITFGESTCQSRKSGDLDAAVVARFFEALVPAELEIALATLKQIESERQRLDRQWHLQVERAEYATQLARRRYMGVEPENQLVARSLEQEWNQCLEHEQQLRQEYLNWQQSALAQSPLSEHEQQQILALAQNVPALWRIPTLSHRERKQMLRLLISSVTLRKTSSGKEVDICWQTRAHTSFVLADSLLSCDKYRTDPHLVELVRQLANDHTDRQICLMLCQQGWKNAHGQPLTVARIRGLRRDYTIPAGSPERPSRLGQQQRADGRYSAQAVAQMLHVDPSTIHDWCKAGRLDWVEQTRGGTRWIRLHPEEIETLRQSVHRRNHTNTEAVVSDQSHDLLERGAL